LGWVKDGKIKVQDGDTGKVSWRSVRRGLMADFDGDPTSTRHNYSEAKVTTTHSPRSGRPRKRTPDTKA
jgi:hypothetical protein